ncbi:hypothetical protein CEXT_526381 [Caerostris extrusa]|uniref:Uncharacterized protein n=1 Tax=Caerostris extrusa TaxID=172846 RepID=A0AAV4UTS1_CAEEX|nr:hypothetical protein CEXT_526381 [Caerostris extrusa]
MHKCSKNIQCTHVQPFRLTSLFYAFAGPAGNDFGYVSINKRWAELRCPSRDRKTDYAKEKTSDIYRNHYLEIRVMNEKNVNYVHRLMSKACLNQNIKGSHKKLNYGNRNCY